MPMRTHARHILVAALVLLPGPALAGVAEDLRACAAIGPATQRLDCYDRLAAGKAPAAADGAVLAQFAGSGAQNTRPFQVAGPWEIQWDFEGTLLQIFVFNKGGAMAGVAANQQGSEKICSSRKRTLDHNLRQEQISPRPSPAAADRVPPC